MTTSRKGDDSPPKRRPPAKTPAARERQLIILAMDEAEKQLRSGKASSQMITHFLKLATVRESLEREKIAHENELLKARTEAIESGKVAEELYGRAIEAITKYQGRDEDDDY